VTAARGISRDSLIRRGFALEYATLAWNVIGIVVLAFAAVAAWSVALAGFGLDSLIEIGASTVVVWELSGTGEARQRRALRLIGVGFAALALHLLVQSTWVLAAGFHPRHSPLGIGWTAVTAVVMFALAAGKARTGAALGNPVLNTEGRVTLIDGLLATAVLLGLVLNTAVGWWWADPAAGYVLVYYGVPRPAVRTSPHRGGPPGRTDRGNHRFAVGEGRRVGADGLTRVRRRQEDQRKETAVGYWDGTSTARLWPVPSPTTWPSRPVSVWCVGENTSCRQGAPVVEWSRLAVGFERRGPVWCEGREDGWVLSRAWGSDS
jgi:hypothetical protein